MAELKPVPSGYDSAALSSMLGYLANARKSHDNNPMMRVLLDQQARDNKAEYLADADLTRGQQLDENDYVKQLNLAQLLQKDQSDKASRAAQMFTTSGGGLRTDVLSEDQGLGAQSDGSMDAVLGSLAQAAALKGRGAAADINKTYAETAGTNMNTKKTGAEIINLATEQGDLDGGNINNPPDEITVNLDQMPANVRSRQQADALVESTRQTNTNKGNVPSILVDGKRVTISRQQAEQLRDQGRGGEVEWREESLTDENTSRATTRAAPKVMKQVTDIETVKNYVAENNIENEGIGTDEKGPYVLIGGKKHRVNNEGP